MPASLLGLLLVATPAPATASPGDTGDEAPAPPPSEIEDSVATGALLPWSIAARHERRGVLAHGQGGYDTAKSGPVMTGTLEATLIDRGVGPSRARPRSTASRSARRRSRGSSPKSAGKNASA